MTTPYNIRGRFSKARHNLRDSQVASQESGQKSDAARSSEKDDPSIKLYLLREEMIRQLMQEVSTLTVTLDQLEAGSIGTAMDIIQNRLGVLRNSKLEGL
jgi:division protein CdvB (Snf7/Vps24/ESCRT-III family)